jgi:hypothetical protein
MYTGAYTLQRYIQKLIPDFRVSWCCQKCGFAPDRPPRVDFYARGSSIAMRGLAYCGSVWACPVCAWYIQLKREKLVTELFNKTISAGYGLVHVVLTFHHTKYSTCTDMLELQRTAWLHMTRSRRYRDWKKHNGIKWYMRALELTYSGVTGWHPHYHMVFVIDPLVDPREFDELYLMWADAVSAAGSYTSRDAYHYKVVTTADAASVAVFSEYSTKGGGAWSLSHELTRTSVKFRSKGVTPFQLACMGMDGDTVSAAEFVAYTHATRGARAHTWAGGWLKWAALVDTAEDVGIDDVVLDDVPTDENTLVLQLSGDNWRLLGNAREQLIESVINRDGAALLVIFKYRGVYAASINPVWFNLSFDDIPFVFVSTHGGGG